MIYRLIPNVLPLLGLLVAAGCVSNPPEEDRLIVEQLAEARPTERAAGDARRPQSVPQPQVKRPAHPEGVFRATYGIGTLDQDSSGPPRLDDDATTHLVRLEMERVEDIIGGGVQISAWFPGGLHESSSVGRADTWMGEVYPHITVRPTAGELFRMPIRVGPLFHYVDQDFDSAAGGELLRYSVGGRAEVAPELDIVTEPGFRMSLYGNAHYGYGWSLIDVQSAAVDEEFDTNYEGFGGGFGLRFLWDSLDAQVGYQRSHTDYDTSDPEQGIVLPGTDFRFDGFTFSLGTRW